MPRKKKKEPKPKEWPAPKLEGAPCKLTPAVHDKIVSLVRVGNFVETAVRAAGIGKTTFYRWMKMGESDDRMGVTSKYHDLWNDVAKASAESEALDVALLAKAAKTGNIKAIQFRLERRHKSRWARGASLDLTVSRGPDLTKMSDEDLDALMRIAQKYQEKPEE